MVTISYAGYDFMTTGRPHFSRTVRYETDAEGARPHRATATYSIQQIFREEAFAMNQLRYDEMMRVLRENAEGQLVIADEYGNEILNVRAHPVDSTLPVQWGQYQTEVTVQFTSVEEIPLATESATSAICGTVTLQNVTAWRESLKADRPTVAVNNRRETIGSVALAGKIVANAQLPEPERRAYLHTERAAICALMAVKESRLRFGTFDQVVRVETADADIKDGSYSLEWALTVTYRFFPGTEFLELEYDVSTREDLERSERIITVTGKVRANALALAHARINTLNAVYVGVNRTLRSSDRVEQNMDGKDGAVNFNEVAFTSEFREPIDRLRWTLSIATRRDVPSGQIITTYSGQVTGGNASSALVQAQVLGLGKPGLLLASTETVGTSQSGTDPVQFVSVDFSYEYTTKGDWIYAEVTSDTDLQTFGQNTTTVSGTATALNKEGALSVARSFRPETGLKLATRESWRTIKKDSGTLFVTVDFSYSFFLAAGEGSIEYGRQVSKDYEAREISTSLSGTAYGPDSGACHALIDSIVPLADGTNKLVRDDRTDNRLQSASAAGLVSVAFSVSFIQPMALGDPNQILEAEVSLSITYSVNHAVFTPIPFGEPHVQANCGWTPAVKSVSGACLATSPGAAQEWARLRRPLAIAGGFEDPPEERGETLYARMNPSVPKGYRCSFTYAARFPKLVLGS